MWVSSGGNEFNLQFFLACRDIVSGVAMPPLPGTQTWRPNNFCRNKQKARRKARKKREKNMCKNKRRQEEDTNATKLKQMQVEVSLRRVYIERYIRGYMYLYSICMYREIYTWNHRCLTQRHQTHCTAATPSPFFFMAARVFRVAFFLATAAACDVTKYTHTHTPGNT